MSLVALALANVAFAAVLSLRMPGEAPRELDWASAALIVVNCAAIVYRGVLR